MTEAAVESVAEPNSQSPGAILRQARQSRGRGIEDVAYALKLTPKQVTAIEQDKFDLLPGTTFARGFVRNYARLFELDAQPLLTALERQLSQRQVNLSPLSNAAGTMPVSVAHRGVPRALLAALLLVAIGLVVVVNFDRLPPASWSGLRSGAGGGSENGPVVSPLAVSPGVHNADPLAPAPGTASAPNADGAVTVAPASESVAVPAPVVEPALPAKATAEAIAPPAASAGQSARSLHFRFTVESWVTVRDSSGKILVSKLNKPGSSLEVAGRPPFALVVGNARGVQLDYDGKAVDLKPHTAVSIARLKLD